MLTTLISTSRYIIPSMIKAKTELAEQAIMKREMNITNKAEARLAELEADGLTITADIRRRVYVEETQKYQPSNGKHHHNGNGATRDLPFG